MFRFFTVRISKKQTKPKPETTPEAKESPEPVAPTSPTPTPPSTTRTADRQRIHTSIFSRLFASKKPGKVPQDADTDAGTSSIRSPRSPTSFLSLPSPSPKTPQSFRPGIGQPAVFQRPAQLGTAGTGIILPKRKDGRDLWTASDNPLCEEPDAQERLKSKILVTGWLDAGAAVAAGAEDGETDQANNRKSEEQEKVNAISVSAPASTSTSAPAPAPAPSPPSKLVLHIDTDTHNSLSAPVPADEDNKEDQIPDLDASVCSTADSPSIITHHTGEVVWSSAVKSLPEGETDPPHVGTLLSTIAEPDPTAEEEERDQVGADLPPTSPLPEKKRRHRSVLGMGMARLGSRRFAFRPLSRANTNPTKRVSTTIPTTATASEGGRRSLGSLIRRQPTTPSEADLAIAEEKMVQPVVHTPATLSAQIMEIEDEEQRRIAEMVFG